ncbi:MAG: catalase [Candidatus Muiribacterium halophilum]|uniref:Catalase n=1 Tax=Muiribacterium halophilum TaxID=2053465 RepID=A0A2N5ZIE2_MUIH1|nr:MAG: catalase [Candidatus Muirbacterium halophilum]
MNISRTESSFYNESLLSKKFPSKNTSIKEDLTDEEKKTIQELKKTDREVRQHEQAHKSAAGSISVKSPSFTYKTGPDGKKYAVGGEVSIDVSEGKTPEETIKKAQQIKKAALAPANPSSQDKKIASQAQAMESRAKREQSKKNTYSTENENKIQDPDIYSTFSITA